MRQTIFFDYERAAAEAGLDERQLATIEEVFRADYPADPMLYELHVLRACNALRDGRMKFDQAFGEAYGQRFAKH